MCSSHPKNSRAHEMKLIKLHCQTEGVVHLHPPWGWENYRLRVAWLPCYSRNLVLILLISALFRMTYDLFSAFLPSFLFTNTLIAVISLLLAALLIDPLFLLPAAAPYELLMIMIHPARWGCIQCSWILILNFLCTMQSPLVSERLYQTCPGGQREPGGRTHASSLWEICTSEYNSDVFFILWYKLRTLYTESGPKDHRSGRRRFWNFSFHNGAVKEFTVLTWLLFTGFDVLSSR